MKKVNRRTFLSDSLLATAALSLPISTAANTKSLSSQETGPSYQDNGPYIIDTNVNLFDWPFRSLKYGKTQDLREKLKQHRITQAWAGNYEALFYKNIDAVNSRLVEECRKNGDGMFIPFGTVNLNWPDWEEDLRRCHEVYKMPGIRIYPLYQTFDMEHPEFPKLIEQLAKRDMILQIAVKMEDARHHHPIVHVRDINAEPLIDIMKKIPSAKVQLLHWNRHINGKLLERLVQETKVALDISRVEGSGAVGHLIEGEQWTRKSKPVPVERLFFGSHAPFFPVESSIIKLFEAPLTLDQILAIINNNARRFLRQG
ncbi:MAG: amidohydrolase family protein [Balneolales bacterium]